MPIVLGHAKHTYDDGGSLRPNTPEDPKDSRKRVASWGMILVVLETQMHMVLAPIVAPWKQGRTIPARWDKTHIVQKHT